MFFPSPPCYAVCLNSGGLYSRFDHLWLRVSLRTLRTLATAYDWGYWVLPRLWVAGPETLSGDGAVRVLGDENQLGRFVTLVLTRSSPSVDMADSARDLASKLTGSSAGITDWTVPPVAGAIDTVELSSDSEGSSSPTLPEAPAPNPVQEPSVSDPIESDSDDTSDLHLSERLRRAAPGTVARLQQRAHTTEIVHSFDIPHELSRAGRATKKNVGASTSRAHDRGKKPVDTVSSPDEPSADFDYGIDERAFTIEELDPATTPYEVHTRGQAIVLFRPQFKYGLRLPLDPFLCDFCEFARCLPIDLNLNTLMVLVSFAVISRLLGHEPNLSALFKYYNLQFNVPGLSLKTKSARRNPIPKIFTKPLNRFEDWQCDPIVVEGRFGWSFPRPDSPHPVRFNVTYPDREIGAPLTDALEGFLGVLHNGIGAAVFDMVSIVDNEELLIRGGISPMRHPFRSKPLVAMDWAHSDPDWTVHIDFKFSFDCVFCGHGTSCTAPFLHGLYPFVFRSFV